MSYSKLNFLMLVPTVILIFIIESSANHGQQNNHHLRHHNHTLNPAAENISKNTNHHNHTHPRSHHYHQQHEIQKTKNNNKNSPYIAINSNHYGDGGGHGSYGDARRVQQSDQNWRTTGSRYNNNNNYDREGIEMIDDEWKTNAERQTPKTPTTTTRTVPRKKIPRQNGTPRQNSE